MSILRVWCQACMAPRPHTADGQEIACSGCGLVRPGLVGLVGAAESAMRIVGLAEYMQMAAQVADLQRYGSPGDLPDNPLT